MGVATAQEMGGWSATGPVLAADSILTSDLACTGVFDLCAQCDGENTICLGCDLVPNSGKVVDLCGDCGGVNLCVGCDDVVNSGTNSQKSRYSVFCSSSTWHLLKNIFLKKPAHLLGPLGH